MLCCSMFMKRIFQNPRESLLKRNVNNKTDNAAGLLITSLERLVYPTSNDKLNVFML